MIGTASASNVAFVRELGAETVIDYTREAFDERVKDLDVALDSMGGEIQNRTLNIIKRGGRLVSLVFGVNQDLAHARGVQASGVLVRPEASHLDAITRLLAEGQLKVEVETVLPLREVARAHDLVEGHHVRGKVVLEIK